MELSKCLISDEAASFSLESRSTTWLTMYYMRLQHVTTVENSQCRILIDALVLVSTLGTSQEVIYVLLCT